MTASSRSSSSSISLLLSLSLLFLLSTLKNKLSRCDCILKLIILDDKLSVLLEGFKLKFLIDAAVIVKNNILTYKKTAKYTAEHCKSVKTNELRMAKNRREKTVKPFYYKKYYKKGHSTRDYTKPYDQRRDKAYQKNKNTFLCLIDQVFAVNNKYKLVQMTIDFVDKRCFTSVIAGDLVISIIKEENIIFTNVTFIKGFNKIFISVT